MLVTEEYDRVAAVEYAEKWAYYRNPEYYDFNEIGGDCTNFASQCLLAGSKTMNYPMWYYYSSYDRSPSWTGVEFLYDFLIKNNGLGPRGRDADISEMRAGDLVQLSFAGERFEHTPFIVSVDYPATPSGILVAAHTNDAACRPLDSYKFSKIRFIHIENIGIDR